MFQVSQVSKRTLRLGSIVLVSLSLWACASSPVVPVSAASAVTGATAVQSSAALIKAELPGVYELVYSRVNNAIYVASMGERFEDGKGGSIYQLDADTLALQKTIELPLKPFALAIDNTAGVLYAGHTLDGAISAIDISTGTVRKTVQHGALDAEGKPIHTRQIVVDETSGKIIVSGITSGGFLWVVDGNTLTTDRIIRDSKAPTAGLTLDTANHQLFVSGTAAYAVFDTRTWQQVGENRILEKRNASDSKRRFLVNTALDGKTGRLFANQLNNGEGTLVFDVKSGELLHTIATGETPVGIRFNPQRGEVYVASRDSGTLSIIDAQSYAIKHSLTLPAHPNSIAVSPDGQTLWISVKQPFPEKGESAKPEQVVRIDLNAAF